MKKNNTIVQAERMGHTGRMRLTRSMGRMSLLGLVGLCLLGLVGCQHETDVPEPWHEGDVAISFSGNLSEEENVTRATPLEDSKTSFYVWAYKNDGYSDATSEYTSYQSVMPQFLVNWVDNSAYTTTSNTHEWEYVGQAPDQTIKYWDWSAKAYRFFGYAGNLSDLTVDESDASKVSFSFDADASSDASIAATPYVTDLWFSTGNLAQYPDRQFGRAVQLMFKKPFARVRFLFTFVEGLSFGREKLSQIRFYPTKPSPSDPAPIIATAGTVNVTYPLTGTGIEETWTTSGTTGINAFTIDHYDAPSPVPDGYPLGSAATDWPNTPNKWYTVLPAPSQGSFMLEVAVVSEEIKTAVVPAEYMQWKAGFEYTYKFKITESGGITMDVIQVAINDWGNKKSSEHYVYNW